MQGRRSRYTVLAVTALTVLVVGAVPVQAAGVEYMVKYRMPTDVAGVGGGLPKCPTCSNSRTPQSVFAKACGEPQPTAPPTPEPPSGPYVIKPINPTGGGVTDASSGTALLAGGLAGSGAVDPVLRAENSMRRMIRSLD